MGRSFAECGRARCRLRTGTFEPETGGTFFPRPAHRYAGDAPPSLSPVQGATFDITLQDWNDEEDFEELDPNESDDYDEYRGTYGYNDEDDGLYFDGKDDLFSDDE